MENSKISWTDHTFNPWRGCTKVSPGCENCYAEARDIRYEGGKHWGKDAPRILSKTWNDPLRWEKEAATTGIRKKVFCASLADVFDQEVPDEWRIMLFNLIEKCTHLDWLILTKRTQAMSDWFALSGIIQTNIWLGTTVEDQQRADERVPILCRIPAKIHWLSVEPQLGPVSLRNIPCPYCDGNPRHADYRCGSERIDWVISGGESGTNARGFNLDWARDLKTECKQMGVAFFMKQLGSSPYVQVNGHKLLGIYHGKADDPKEWEEDLRIQEFPHA